MGNFKGFTSVELRKPQRSLFDLSHESRLSTRMGRLTPIFISETIPNDTFRVNSEVFLRMAPMIAPIMHRVNVYVHYFFIPNRLLWIDWEPFITGGRLGTETPPVPPNVNINTVLGRNLDLLDIKSLADYLGVGTILDSEAASYSGILMDIMPFAAYYKVWYDYYRDRNYVVDNTILPLPSGTTTLGATIDTLLGLKTRSWEKDYFTSALPWTQRGSQVLMPLAGSGTVSYLTKSLVKTDTGGIPSAGNLRTDGADSNLQVGATNVDGRIENINTVNITTSGVTINDLRRSVRLQEWLERNALAGSRYNESILAHFGRKTSDARLQRAEYLGSGGR